MHELNETKHVFLSYNWSIKNQVKQLDEHLTNLGFKVMRDENFLQANESSLKGQLANAIKNARIFICCITQAYCQSHACNLEIELADSLDKPMIVLMIAWFHLGFSDTCLAINMTSSLQRQLVHYCGLVVVL